MEYRYHANIEGYDMSNYVIISAEDYCVRIEYEVEESISDLMRFEGIRIESLENRGIEIKTETRIWDSIRSMTVSEK